MATLIVLSEPAIGARVVLKTSGQTTLGRDPTCDLIVNKRSISRFHAQVIHSQGEYLIEDLTSNNGTYVNGSRIRERTRLSDGDQIFLHEIPLVFSLSDDMSFQQALKFLPADDALIMPPPSALATSVEAERFETHSYLRTPIGIRGRLKLLIEITQAIGSSLEVKEILPSILDLLFRMFPTAVIGEFYLADENHVLKPVAMKHGREADSTDLTGVPANFDLIQSVFTMRQGIVHTGEATTSKLALDGFFHSVICAPVLYASSQACGVILLESNDSSSVFTEDDLELLSAVAVLTGQAIGYSQAHEIVVQHNNTLRQMETARQIQLGMLPRQHPILKGYHFSHHYAAAERVGGDYFFYEMLRDGRMMLGIADASGKGLPAAMNIARFAGEVRFRIATSLTLKAALASLNQLVIDGTEECMFITCCLCILDPQLHQVAIANAGHPPPISRRTKDNSVEELLGHRRNFPLGIMPEFNAHPWIIHLEPGDQIILYTDGVTEAMNRDDEIFGSKRLLETIAGTSGGVDDQIRSVVDKIERFRDGRAVNDDMTLVGIERLAP